MGVTLERVQNKFACIIGELCSEPDILSQFAIWVDLRIAEYKAKGSISLECSGEDPNPTWLRGFRPSRSSRARERTPDRHLHGVLEGDRRLRESEYGVQNPAETVSGLSSWARQTCSDSLAADRLSPDVTVIKDEPEEIYSVSMVRSGSARKRPAELEAEPSHRPHPHRHTNNTPAKVQRRSPPSNTDLQIKSDMLEPVHESLMSIIGREGGEVGGMGGDVLHDSDIAVLTGDGAQNDSSTPSASDIHVTSPTARGDNSTARNTEVEQSEENADDLRQRILETMEVASDTGFLYPTSYPARLSQDVIRRKVLNIGAPKSQQTVTNMVTVICRLERWWWLKYNERRPVENVPAEELDAYLAEFFTALVRPDGQEYDTCHVSKARSNLDRFLRESGYPYSISKSEKFSASQQAVKDKRQQLQQKAVWPLSPDYSLASPSM